MNPALHAPVGAHRHGERHHGDAVLPRQVGSLRHVHQDRPEPPGGEAGLHGLAVGAERVGELDHCLLPGADPELGQVDVAGRPAPDPPKKGPGPVERAARAEAGGGRQQGQAGDQPGEDAAGRMPSGQVGERRRPEEGGTDLVRELHGSCILDRSLAQDRLDDAEVEPAGQAPAPSEEETGGDLHGRHGDERPGPGEQRREGQQPGEELVEPRGPSVDDAEVANGVGGPERMAWHVVRYNGHASATPPERSGPSGWRGSSPERKVVRVVTTVEYFLGIRLG